MKILQKAIVGAILGLILSITMVMFTNYQTKAYTSSNMPSGYRLITSSDVGKSFGLELNNTIYFDTSIIDEYTNLPNLTIITFESGDGLKEESYNERSVYGYFLNNMSVIKEIVEWIFPETITGEIQEERTTYLTDYLTFSGTNKITYIWVGNYNFIYVKDNVLPVCTFETNGGSTIPGTNTNPVNIANYNPTKEGYTFEGWYYDSALTKPCSSLVNYTSDITLYAKWEINSYTITFNSNGGSNISPLTNITSLPTLPTPTKEGYIFAGWYFDSAFTTQAILGNAITSDTTLYAKWEINSYTITFNSNGGSNISPLTNITSLPTLPTPTKEGYTFAGWYFNSELTTQAILGNAITSDTTLYAKWEINSYTITFNSNGGFLVPNQIINPSEFYADNTINNVTFTKNNSKFNVDVGDGGASATTFYKLCTIQTLIVGHKYLLKGGSISGGNNILNLRLVPVDVNYTTIYDYGNGSIFTADTSAVYCYIAVYTILPTGTYVFEPQLIDLTIMFGVGNEPATIAKYNEYINSSILTLSNITKIPVELPTPTKANNEFIGWYYDKDLTQPASSGETITADTFLYAKWNIDPLFQAREEGIQEGMTQAFTFINFAGELVRVFFSSFFVILSFSVFGFKLYELLLIPALMGAILLIWKAFKG